MTTPPQPAAASCAAALRVTPVASAADRAAFLDLPYRAYRGQPGWRAPLRMERAAQLDPAQNKGLANIDHALFLARRGTEVVGRIAAIVNHAHIEIHQDGTGHFGFLDTLAPDPEAVSALIAVASNWLRAQGMTRIRGPFSFSINEETGLLIDGFETPPMILMPHGRPDYAPALESVGLVKAMDMHAFHYAFGEAYTMPPRVRRLVDAFHAEPALSIRPLDMRNFKADIALIMDLFNDAWAENWGFVPFSAAQIEAMASELKPLIHPRSLWIASVGGEPAAFTLFLPDINEMADGLDGRLLPFGWAQLLYRLKIRGPRRARLPLAGLRRKYHKSGRGLLAMAGCFEAAFRAQHEQGVREVEASWVLEVNRDLLKLITLYDMSRYKTYRVYEKPL
ncbi:hypothetical protein RA2_00369 [Roseovarius sp. A-2]|uniref:hypothetical protein n=1 Tax=Roseovarius sp. A-2 TaxID=1570360 RepID=UPI0009B50318|nr:hypothetical protein [Roseovarius sp. A-2]GAW33333.1 hypothetical protein RA2_00369 [Roseovarius sp. A-2]